MYGYTKNSVKMRGFTGYLQNSSQLIQQASAKKLEDIEIDLLCEGIFRHYGFDFRQYARASLARRIQSFMELENINSISDVQNKILHSQQVMERFLLNLSVNVTSMFRDVGMYLAFRKKIVPVLHTYPSIRIWHAGCSTGEEVYSLAILLQEEQLADKATIYATDINEVAIKKAKEGIFPLQVMQTYTTNYLKAGGKKEFSRYYTAKYDHAILAPELRNKIVFAKHNLVTDSSFNEFTVIFCRNVMIYFNETLRSRVHHLLYNSLCRFGTLILGHQETINLTPTRLQYKTLDEQYSIFQKRA
ncbi:CheR family methyltransferase [Spartinivicinus marinus]|nr:protein-glutamate O-methyltransferase CheR [Spartinivicinus marinus]